MKQTSVEWLAQAIYEKMKMRGDGRVFQGILDKAKEMHKEEMLEFGYFYAESVLAGNMLGVAEYYNETYGGEK